MRQYRVVAKSIGFKIREIIVIVIPIHDVNILEEHIALFGPEFHDLENGVTKIINNSTYIMTSYKDAIK